MAFAISLILNHKICLYCIFIMLHIVYVCANSLETSKHVFVTILLCSCAQKLIHWDLMDCIKFS